MSLVGAALIWNDPKGAGIDQEWWLGKCGEGSQQSTAELGLWMSVSLTLRGYNL